MMGVLIYYDLVVYIIGLCIFIPCWCMIIMYYQVYMYKGVLPRGCIYDSYMTDFVGGVKKPLRLTFNLPYSFLITSADVIHSFSVPDLGIKLDGVPGRINCLMSMIDRLGVYVGYCTELCGAGHGYMPIVVEVLWCYFFVFCC
ncbi:unnamed protein product [Trichobilharzia regenti]|nr:unnamed protein product [Trichobilharzia regenti]